ncbi:carboxymuconolactone decarboxylase family protein [Cytobacillus kochii]|uniref:carboxymuconolactone decarboxylase family protein n=1 Tax=Cytobacillus kochii TaxID=859143 RepID=UPI0025A12AFC|nr:carboxymuconolactone decarboxylase family protein [Cytobacillus kochii]MDM5206343.1 carboxymuconolactone decarboxylase family protein [Cytobacillus kochii]
MARIVASNIGETPFQRLLGHNSELLEDWSRLGDTLETKGFLSAELKEQVRRALAQGNGCTYCKAKGRPEPDKYNEKTAIAVGFAEVFLKKKGDISHSSFEVLKEIFTVEEISELCAFICFTTASQYFGAMMNLEGSRPLSN